VTSFFLPGPAGNLFGVYYSPMKPAPAREDVLYVHPFAGEMNHSRALIAALARELAALGRGVLTIDLYGCGDSAGSFGDALWEGWKEDLAAAVRWLRDRGTEQLSLWGLRLGALLALDFARHAGLAWERIVLWQPVLRGDQMMTQFIHANLLPSEGSGWIRERMKRRQALPPGYGVGKAEVGGYELAPELVEAIDRAQIEPSGCPDGRMIHWTEVVSSATQPMTVASQRVIESWKQHGAMVEAHKVEGWPFWLFPHSTEATRLRSELQDTFMEKRL
jgi:exosortase A-associated hydrolase 2